MNDLETNLRSWKPRRVGARIERSLFGRSRARKLPTTEPARPAHRATLPWLAPVTAAILLLALLRNQGGYTQLAMSEANTLASAALSNQTAAAWLPGSFAADQNNVPSQRLEWTNMARSTSSIRSLSGPKVTN